jgi:hypothetical protein
MQWGRVDSKKIVKKLGAWKCSFTSHRKGNYRSKFRRFLKISTLKLIQ